MGSELGSFARVGRLPILASIALAACAKLDSFTLGTCGNAVLEPGEDCDTFSDPSLGPGTECRAVASGCRYVCGGSAICPEGWACGEDGVCRHASGCFDRRGVHQRIPAFEQAALGDIDGDGRSDLVLRRGANIHVSSGQREGGFEARPSIAADNVRGPFILADLELDGREDVVVPVAASTEPLSGFEVPAVLALRGTIDGVEPLGFTPNLLDDEPSELVAVRGHPAQRDHDILVSADHFVEELEDSRIALFFSTDRCPGGVDEVSAGLGVLLSPPPKRLSSPPLAVYAASSGGRDLIAYPSEDRITVLEMQHDCNFGCPGQGLRVCADRLITTATIALPEGTSALRSQTFFADFDGDLEPDVASVIERPGGPEPWDLMIAHSNGRGGFVRADGDPFGARIANALPMPACGNEDAPILAVADFDGDGFADVVSASGIVGRRPGSPGFALLYVRSSGAAWTRAIADDFDDDGRVDLVVVTIDEERRCRSSRVELLVNRGAAGFERAMLPSGDDLGPIESGDFDGDGVSDLAVIENLGSKAEVVIYFGDSNGPLVERTTAGTVPPVSSLAAVRARDGNPTASDLIATTGVITPRYARVRTNSSRRFTIPLELTREPVPGVDSLRLAFARSRMYIAGHSDLWTIDGLPESTSKGEVLHPGRAIDFDYGCAALAVVPGEGGFLLAADRVEPDGFVFNPIAPDSLCPHRLNEPPRLVALGGSAEATSVGGPCSTIRKMELADLDANGRSELVLTMGRTSNDVTCGQEGVLVAWNVAFDPKKVFRVETSAIAMRDLEGESPLHSSAVLNADIDRDLEIATWELASGVSIVDHFGEELFHATPLRSRIDPIALEQRSDRVALLAGDVDGDGLADLVEVAGHEVAVHRSIPHDERERSADCTAP